MSSNDQVETIYWAALAACPVISPTVWQQLWPLFESGESIWRASRKELAARGVPEKIQLGLERWRGQTDPERFWEKIKFYNLLVKRLDEDDYPALLKEIADPPIVLYIKGNWEPAAAMVGVVGSRLASGYGYRMTDRLVMPLVRAGLTVVSGLALGIDGAAHRVTIRESGKTIAVLAHGLDRVCPSSHRGLAQDIIAKGGALVSEYSPGTVLQNYYFLHRNRIIAGMSMGLVVVEAGERSGALTTARLALESGRSVFAVPGDAERNQSTGVNNLIRQGAFPVTDGKQILQELNLPGGEEMELVPRGLRPEEKIVWEALGREPTHIDKLAAMVNQPAAKLNVILMNLELRGMVRNVGGMQYIRV